MLSYLVTLELDTNHMYLVTFPDVPEAISSGDDEDEALLNALDALESAIEIYFDEKREVPMPSKTKKGEPVVTLPALVVSKVLLANEMIRQGVRKAELARRLNVHMPQVDRLLDPRHASKLEAIEAAFFIARKAAESLGRVSKYRREQKASQTERAKKTGAQNFSPGATTTRGEWQAAASPRAYH